MKESVAIAKEADTMFSPTKSSDKSIHRARNEPERQLGSLRGVIDSIRSDGGTPSVDSIATELSSIPSAQRAPVLMALQRTHGNQYVQRVVTGIQAKLKVGQPGDIYEQEADRVADAVMRMPKPQMQWLTEEEEEEEKEEEGTLQTKLLSNQITPLVQRQVEGEEEIEEEEVEEEELIQTKPITDQITPLVQRPHEEEEEENLQTKRGENTNPEVTHDLESQINAIHGGGKLLSESERAYFEPRFGYDFREVRVHTDTRAAESARAVNARAYAVGRDVVFGAGQYAPGASEGRRLMAHELTHVMQQASGTVIQRDPNNISSIDRLRQLLQDNEEDEAIELMGRLSAEEVRAVLMSREFKELAMDAFNNDEMYRGIRAMRGDLYRSLEWMFDEGTDWGKVRDVITRAPSGKDRVRTDNWMKDQFVSICNDEEMAEAVDSLQGTLLQKLRWMAAEGSNWDLVKTKLQDSTIPQTEKTDLYNHDSMKNFFVSVCNDEEMAEAVDLLQGTLLQKLRWMAAEGSNWDLVRTKIEATTIVTEKTDLYSHDDIRDFFVDVCNNKTIIIATRLLGGTWAQKTTWMEAEGVTAPVAGEMEEMLGEEAKWVPFGVAHTFRSWAEASSETSAPPLKKSTTINCWEMILLAAYRVGVIDWKWISDLYTAIPISPASNWVNKMASSTTPYVPGTSTLSRGDLVFFDELAHVALATGKKDEVYTFWPPPDKPSSIGTIDEVKTRTIKALSDYMGPIWGTPVVTFGTPAW